MDIKLIALDLDGTTFNSKSRLTKRTKETLEMAIEKGIHVVIATGRTYGAVPEEVLNIKGMEFICTSNGAEIREPLSGKLICSSYISSDAVLDAVRLLENEEYMIETFTGGRAYTDAHNYELAKKGILGYRNQEYIVNTRNPVDNIFDFMREHCDSIENINVNFKSMDDRAMMEPKLRAIKNTTVTSSFPHNWEIGGKDTSKRNALSMLCSMLGIEPYNILAAGDSPNDSAMLEFAGVSVAVSNAVEEIRNMAYYVTDSNDNDGVAKAIEKFAFADKN